MFSAHIPDAIADLLAEAETEALRTRRLPRLVATRLRPENDLPSDLTIREMQPSRPRRLKRLVIHALRHHAEQYTADQVLFMQVIETAILDIGTPNEDPGWFLTDACAFYAERVALEPDYIVRLLRGVGLPVDAKPESNSSATIEYGQLQLFPLDIPRELSINKGGLPA